jgi:hypothetical protein
MRSQKRYPTFGCALGKLRWYSLAVLVVACLLGLASEASATCSILDTIPPFQPGGNVFGSNSVQWGAYFGGRVDANNGTACNLSVTGTFTINGSDPPTLAGSNVFTGANNFTISPTGPTPSTSDNSTKLATTAYVKAQGYGLGTVTSVGLSLPGIFTVTGSPVTGSGGTLTATLATQSPNLVWAGPTSGAAAAPGFRALVGPDLPVPSASSLGGIESIAQVSNEFVQYIDTSGVPHLATPPTANYALASGFINKLRNPGMDVFQRGTSGTVTAATSIYSLDGWVITPTGVNENWAQEYNANLRGNALRLSAASGLTATNIYQDIESYVAAQLLTANVAVQTLTVQFTIYNNSGSTITPQITTAFATALDNFGSVTTDLAATNLQACTNATVCTEAYTFTPSISAVHLGQGYRVQLLLGGALNGASGYVDISDADIRVTTGIATGLNASPPVPEIRPIGLEMPFDTRYLNVITGGGSGQASNASIADINFSFPTMRVTPSNVTFPPGSLGATVVDTSTGTFSQSSAAISISSSQFCSAQTCVVRFINFSGMTVNHVLFLDNTIILFTAEL